MKFLKEEEKQGIPHAFSSAVGTTVKFYDYFRMLPETFWYILNDIRDDIQKQSNFGTAYLLRKD